MEKRRVYIQTNNKQLLGAKIAKFAIETHLSEPIPVEIINSDTLPDFKEVEGFSYKFNETIERRFDHNDLQSFTLTRFIPPELMEFTGLAVVIDPDIFALGDLQELFSKEMNGAAILACPKKNAWDTSVMLLDCTKLHHWKIRDMLRALRDKKRTYTEIMTLANETSVKPLDRSWNSLDSLTEETKMLHTTGRLTQPWKTGLPIDFTRNPLPKYFGIIPREPLYRLIGKYPTHYQPHPDKKIERFFLRLAAKALESGAIKKDEITEAISQKNIRPDFFEVLDTF